MKIINPATFENLVKQINAGKYVYVDSIDFEIPFSETKPIEGYERPVNFPNCCNFHIQVYTYAKEVFDNFPNCCEDHPKLLKASWFNKEDYKAIPDKIINTLHYTEHHIIKQIDIPDWYEDITNYFEYSYKSFGQLPDGYGNPIGLALYHIGIRDWVVRNDKIIAEKREKLIAYIDNYFKPKKKAEAPDINILVDTYKKWLKVFPFSISFFQDVKVRFKGSFPLMVKDISATNKYTGTASAKIISQNELIDFLIIATKQLLLSVNSTELAKELLITDANKQTVELINEDLRIKNELLLGEYSRGETKYLKILKKWLTYQKEYFRDIFQAIKSIPEPVETKTDKLKKALHKYGFYELDMVKSLPSAGIEKLIEILLTNSLPYQIAMIDFLGFITYLEKEHFPNTKYKMNKEISKWFNSDKEGRRVKGNISSLLPKTTENKERYTAFQHKQTVKKDYSNLK